jgi:hypothetical protein
MIKLPVTHFLFLVAGLVFSCCFTSCTTGSSGLKRSTGAVNELLIVTNDKAQWESALGDTLRSVFAAPLAAVPQPEPIFDLVNIPDENFAGLFENYHNILFVDINPEITETKFETSQDVWASPQRLVRITAPSPEDFYREFDLKKESILKLFIDLERKRTLSINMLDMDYKLSEAVANKFGINMTFPEGFFIAKETPDFMWMRYQMAKTKQDVELGIMIYTMDYTDTVVFNPRHVIFWRNTLTREHIPGSMPGSFMKTSVEFIPPVFDTLTDFPGTGYAVETRGLWEVQNDFMGGAFINYTFIDRSKNKVITLDGYVYNPNDDKRNFLRQLEAVFFSIKFNPAG